MKRIDLTGQYINEWYVEKYLGNKMYHCICSCGNEDNIHADSLRKGYRKSCGHDKQDKINELISKKFNEWTPIKYIGKGKFRCECSCGNTGIVSKYDLINDKSKSCGHDRLIDLTGKQFGDWKVISYAGDKKWNCICSCGKHKEVYGHTLTNGESTSCGHRNGNNGEFQDLTGQQFGEWTVVDYAGESMWNCICSCGSKAKVRSVNLRNGTSKSCGHDVNRVKDITNQRFGKLIAKKYLGNGIWECDCDCGNTIEKLGKSLRNGQSRHCGCETLKAIQNNSINTRSDFQKELSINKDKLVRFIGDRKPTYFQLAEEIGLTYPSTVRICNNFNISNLINVHPNESYKEDELFEYVNKILGDRYSIIRSDRTILNGKELDIYIPDLKLAIEFNGTYWHSTLYKDKNYHQYKTLTCAKQGIKLIHVFEYEWDNPTQRRKILSIIKRSVCGGIEINPDYLCISTVNIDISHIFYDNYYIGDSKASDINIGLKYNNDLIALASFDNIKDNIYMLSKLCTHPDYCIDGHEDKIFKYFINIHNPDCVLARSDISKFKANSFLNMGFKLHNNVITEPDYYWVHTNSNLVLDSKYSKIDKLVNMGICNKWDDEVTVMENMNFVQVYNAGSIQFIYKKI